MTPITLPEAVAYLRTFQKWRRREVDHPQPSPSRVGACFDLVLDAAEKHSAPSNRARGKRKGKAGKTVCRT